MISEIDINHFHPYQPTSIFLPVCIKPHRDRLSIQTYSFLTFSVASRDVKRGFFKGY